MKIRKWTFINVLFSKIQNRFEKTLHHSFFSVRPPHFADLTCMLFFINSSVVTCRPLCCGLYFRRKNAKDGPKSWKAVLWNSWLAIFGGCFGKMSESCFYSFRKDGPKSWKAVLWNSWLAIFGGCFG